MFRYFFAFVSIFFCSLIARADDAQDTSLTVLMRLIDDKQVYMKAKEANIDKLEKQLQQTMISDSLRYLLTSYLYQEYTPYKLDSAIVYARKNLYLGQQKQNSDWITESNLDLAALYFTAGLYIDAYNILNAIKGHSLPINLRIKYYDAWKRLYKFYSLSGPYGKEYLSKSNRYRDSLLQVLDPKSNHYQIVYAEKLFDNRQYEETKLTLSRMLDQSNGETHELAVLAYSLANVYRQEGNIAMQRKYYVLSAICDIKNAIKENASMQALANLLYDTNQIEESYKCIWSSMEDAIFCNARFRTYEASQIFPIINSAYQEKETQKRSLLTNFLIVVCLLSLFLVIAIIYVYRQMKRVNRIRRELSSVNKQLHGLNEQLNQANDVLHETNQEVSFVNKELAESNQIKEAYIGQFLDLCSLYINKLERFQLSLNKMLMAKKMDDLMRVLKSREMIDKEMKELYRTFDHVFLHLYPNFVEDFNSLLVDDMPWTIKPNEVLNTELRIFALIRLGITDSSKIARFLNYSTNTIYTYRTKIRNKAAVPREDFDEMVMKIGRVTKNS